MSKRFETPRSPGNPGRTDTARRPGDGRARERRGNRVPPSSRALALDALRRVDEDEAYANLVLPEMLRAIDDPASGFQPMENRDKAFATELLYGTVRMRRACDWLVRRHLQRDPDPLTERVLHMGAYQLAFLKTPPHAALSSMVGEAPEWSRGFVNAVLRKVAAEVSDAEIAWPNVATELSYPDWIVSTLERDLGPDVAQNCLRVMNEPAVVHRRSDGYVQDPASQAVADYLGVASGDTVLDLCSAPGGKTTALAAQGAMVSAVDVHRHRCDLVASNVAGLGLADRVSVHCLDATALPSAFTDFDHVLVDAPCSGLGSLRRRPDARWRIQIGDVASLVQLQRNLLRSAARAVKPGGQLLYSVCTLTDAETIGNERWFRQELPEFSSIDTVPFDGWVSHGGGVRVLPGETDGMSVFRFRRG